MRVDDNRRANGTTGSTISRLQQKETKKLVDFFDSNTLELKNQNISRVFPPKGTSSRKNMMMWTLQQLAWENAGPRLFYPRNDVWRTSTETSLLMTCYYSLSERGFWLVVPRWKFASTNQKHYPGLGSEMISVWILCSRSSDIISCGNVSYVLIILIF